MFCSILQFWLRYERTEKKENFERIVFRFSFELYRGDPRNLQDYFVASLAHKIALDCRLSVSHFMGISILIIIIIIIINK